LAALARSYQLVITESFPSGADGVELVGLTFSPGGPTRSLDFNHSFTLPLQEDRESCSVAAGTFHRPGSTTGGVDASVSQQSSVPRLTGDGLEPSYDSAGSVDDRGTMGILVGVDANDEIDLICQHKPAALQRGLIGAGLGREDTAWQNCDESRLGRTGF
jgi:hypothetical protein